VEVRPYRGLRVHRCDDGCLSVQFEELRFITQQAAVDVFEKHDRPLPPTVVLPGPARTLLLTLPSLPDDDELRHLVIAELAAEHLTGEGVPCWGFVAEADVAGSDGVITVYGARRHTPHLSAALFNDEGGLDEFLTAEELDPTALPFLHPLQHAVDSLPGAQNVFDVYDPKRAGPSPIAGGGITGGDDGPSLLPMHPG
jgi:hypothetical protein